MFGFLIFIHEFGHYITARIFKVTIEEFSIGMGPRLVTWVSKKTGIRYSISLLPIGGFVAMPGENGEYNDTKSSTDDGGEPEYKGNPSLFGGYRPGNTPKDWAKTYLNSVKTMFLPMLATLGIISAAFLILWILLELAS